MRRTLTMDGLLTVLALLVVATSCVPSTKPKDKLDNKEVAELRLVMAEQLVAQHDYDRALPYLRALRARHPKNLRLRLLFGVVLREKEMYRVAEKELEIVLKRAPKSAEAQGAYAVLMDKMDKHRVAEKHHRKAVEFAPGEARYHNDLGFCFFLQKRFVEAQNSLEQAIRIDPSMRRAFNNLGFVFGFQDRDKDALSAFRQAGSRVLAWTNLGLVAELQGQPGKARRYYEKALRLNASYKPALRNLRALDPQFRAGAEDSEVKGRRATPAEQIEKQAGDKPAESAKPAKPVKRTGETR